MGEEKIGQTKCCWGQGPVAWMHHKYLPLPGFFTLLQNKLSLDCFDNVPRLSCPRGGWQVLVPDRSLAQPIEFSIFRILVVFSSPKSCFPLQLFPHSLLHSCILPSTNFHCFPLQSSVLHFSAAQTPKLPVPQCCSCSSDPCSYQQLCPRVCIVLL